MRWPAASRAWRSLIKWLMKRPDDRIFEVTVHYAGPDPRLTLRAEVPDEGELLAIDRALDRMDEAKPSGPWTRFILGWIRENPAVVSKVLASLLDRDLQPMKTDIRKLKALGLTISLDVGYRLSPRGEAYLDWRAASGQPRWQTKIAVPGKARRVRATTAPRCRRNRRAIRARSRRPG